MGVTTRQRSLRTRAGTVGGRAIPVPRTALEIVATNVRLDWLEFSRSDDAQQLSACACVRTRADPDLCEAPLCIGHSWPSEQQAMRASAVANQPAHTAAFPARSPAAMRTADRRLITIGTALRMLEPRRRVKPRANGSGSIVLGREPKPARSLMVRRTGSGQVQDDDQQCQGERDGADHVDPSRCAV